ncbi:HYDROLASE [Salix koriyanagi]|uniref:HYDROLASE n=1 Tax=Salix koriyanagi TaxID=2511006 RepID=A0A9Q1A076_9ROSI|nr:HYDROLASE [Salix koriyanagi]
MSTVLKLGSPPVTGIKMARKHGSLKASKLKVFAVDEAAGDTASFPSFLPKEVEKIKDPFARSLSKRMQRLPVQVSHLHRDLFINLLFIYSFILLYSLLLPFVFLFNLQQ